MGLCFNRNETISNYAAFVLSGLIHQNPFMQYLQPPLTPLIVSYLSLLEYVTRYCFQTMFLKSSASDVFGTFSPSLKVTIS